MGVYVFPTFILSPLITPFPRIFPGKRFAGLVSTSAGSCSSPPLKRCFCSMPLDERPSKARHIEEKPGREFVTFLLVCNFNLWRY
ncbi:hypothetical protein BV898_19376 [Hypsibius exemplaris]|uniref:Uncharacterized protein n=1 Tax=Hypsibius exemplaris TaxID=2072580 RepID=A0A9X6NIU6_HYPEX|nr:hypothetical protein BV898_19376 [Hypsibius exemplaris]